MTFETLVVEEQSSYAVVKINRPEKLNALNQHVLTELKQVFSQHRFSDSVRAIVLTGEGKAFVAGADIAAMKGLSVQQADEFCQLGHDTFSLIETYPIPIVAAVQGFALGGGLELALACDFIYASDQAKFGLPETKLGLFPGFGGTQRLAKRIGQNLAKELIFTGDVVSAVQAQELGFVNKVVPSDQLWSNVTAVVDKIVKNAPVAIQIAKRVINEGVDLDRQSSLSLERSAFPLVFATEDQTEGVEAFLTKRQPNFQGR